jgi:hypothetical protein
MTLVLNRTRVLARLLELTRCSARVRLSREKEAARGCGGRGPYANSIMGRSGVEDREGCAVECKNTTRWAHELATATKHPNRGG